MGGKTELNTFIYLAYAPNLLERARELEVKEVDVYENEEEEEEKEKKKKNSFTLNNTSLAKNNEEKDENRNCLGKTFLNIGRSKTSPSGRWV